MPMKAFLISHKHFPESTGSVVAAPTAGRAKSFIAGELNEYWGYSFLQAVAGMSCRRIPEFDEKAQNVTIVKVIGTGGRS